MDRMPRMIVRIMLLLVMLGTNRLLSAQSTFHIFPQIADGRFADGSFYRSTIMVLPAFEGDAPQCTLSLYGTAATFPGGGSSPTIPINVPAGGFAAMQTTGTQPYQGGYGTLSCNINVFASVLYTLNATNGVKVGE